MYGLLGLWTNKNTQTHTDRFNHADVCSSVILFQIADEKFLVLINDLLASGEVPDLFPDDEMENMLAGLRSEVKGLGMIDTRENCLKFFIERVRKQLKVCDNMISTLASSRPMRPILKYTRH